MSSNTEYYIVGARPVKVVKTESGGLGTWFTTGERESLKQLRLHG